MPDTIPCPVCRSSLILKQAEPWRRGSSAPVLAPLTKREGEALQLLAQGVRTQQIAARLRVSIHTARAYVKSLLRKFKVHSQAELLSRLQEGSDDE
jgi:DNA-binding CsgD family transcriptional regulator